MQAHPASRPPARNLTVPAVLSMLVALLLVVASAGGLFYGRSRLYEADTANAFVAQDWISLVAVVPLLLVSLWLARRGSTRGLLLWIGTLFYVVYGYAYYVFGTPFGPMFLVYVALMSLSLHALIWVLVNIDPEAVQARVRGPLPRRLIAGFLMAVAVLFATLWTGAIVSALAGGTEIGPVLRLVSTLDLTMPLPALVIAGVLLWRRQAWGYVLAGLALVKTATYGITLVVTAGLVFLWGGPLDPLVVIYSVLAVGGSVLAIPFFRAIDDGAPS